MNHGAFTYTVTTQATAERVRVMLRSERDPAMNQDWCYIADGLALVRSSVCEIDSTEIESVDRKLAEKVRRIAVKAWEGATVAA